MTRLAPAARANRSCLMSGKLHIRPVWMLFDYQRPDLARLFAAPL